MNKSKIAGWKDVFSFTLIQTVKSKAFIVSFIILFTASLVTMPIINMISGNDNEIIEYHIQKVYVNDQSQLSETAFLPVLTEGMFGQVVFVALNEDYNTLLKRIETKETTSVVLDITSSEDGFNLHFTKASNGEVTKTETQKLGDIVVEAFDSYKMEKLNISEEQIELISSEVETRVTTTDINGNAVVEENTKISDAQFWFVFAILFIVMMVTTMSGSQIASSIASDKSTRVVEYLLTSVKPLALMVGKILAMLVAVLGQIILILIGVVVSNTITSSMNNEESLLQKYLPTEVLSNFNFVNIVLCILVIALGLVFFATLAGLAGATVSKIEELSEGMTMFTVLVMVGAYTAVSALNILKGAGTNGFTTFVLLFPLSSPFLLPGAIIIGKVNIAMTFGSIILLIVSVCLLMRFVARIYETLILHTGSTISFKKLFGMAKELKKEGK